MTDDSRSGIVARVLRQKLTYANVMSTVAVFLALAGATAFAASQLAKDSVGTKQIQKGAVTKAKISKSAQKALRGRRGPKGKAGPIGPKGDTGSVAKTLPSGASETGTFANGSNNSGAYVALTFNPPLAVAPDKANLHYLDLTDPRTAQCPGPGQAAPGNLCAYSSITSEPFITFLNPIDNTEGATAFGTIMVWFVGAPTSGVKGNWTVTAP